jgi:LuxR family transcriptional regulator, maltose regulon positive regulatory protein
MPVTPGRAVARRSDLSAVDHPFLLSKLTVPVLPPWVVGRKRITKLVAKGAGRPLTVVTGPAGVGKTVALASWAAEQQAGRVAWVTLDRFDNQPRTFWAYLLEALGQAGVVAPAGLPAVAESQPETFSRQLALALAGQQAAVSLVLDDLHELTNRVCLEELAYVLRNAGSGFHLLAASRMDPLLPLHRYRLTGELTEIRAGDLAFSTLEAELLMAQHRIRLNPESLRVLTSRNEGWAAGLRLAAISMADHPDPGQFVKELANEDGAIAGYLVEEVLNAQPAQARELLLKTSILDRFNTELAAEVAGNTGAGKIIGELAAANAFVEPIGRGWYRYHSLFADVLRLKLRHQSPGKVMQLHRRAALWLGAHGMLAEAVSHATTAGDWPLAARLVVGELSVGSLLHQYASGPIAAAFTDMPDVSGSRKPALLIVAAATTQGEASPPATALLDRAERLLEDLPPEREVSARFAAALVRLELARRRGDLECAEAAAAHAQALAGQLSPGLLTRRPGVHAQVLASRAAIDMWAGRLDDAASILRQATAAACDRWQKAECLGQQALLETIRGRLDQAGKLAAAAIATPGQPGTVAAPDSSAAAHVALAWVNLERNRLTDTAGQLSRAQEALQACPDRLIGAFAWLVAARLSLATGHPAKAVDQAGQAHHGSPVPTWLGQQLALTESLAHAAAGDVPAALAAAKRAGPPSSPTAALALARAHLAATDTHAAQAALAAAPTLTASHAPAWLRLEAHLAQAQLCYTTGHAGRGRHHLTQAVILARSRQLLLPLASQHTWMDPILRHDPVLAAAFRQAFQPAPSLPRKPGSPGQASPAMIEPLTSRELEVLRQVAQMLSTDEIAQQMYLSVNTIKSHLKSIYRKLGVSHRGQAVRRAQQLALL